MNVPKPQKLILYSELEQHYQQAISFLNQSLGTNGTTLKDIAQQLSKKQKDKSDQITSSKIPLKGSNYPAVEQQPNSDLEAVAQAFLKKWLGKTRHQLIPGKSSGIRLQIFELATNARKSINDIMDLLEKGLDVSALGPKMVEVTQQINTLRSLMRSLHSTEKPSVKEPSALEGFF